MSVIVFLGPTLSVERARSIWDYPVYLPPVRQGDVLAAIRRRPVAIGIIDGYFKGVPAVWHKEILWAMSQGIHVFGAASMGALRAAELSAFGMRGIGEVYESLQRGELEDDDEVAVLHGPAELGYMAVSDAMVNIRATITLAVQEGIVSRDNSERLLDLAKSRPYSERNYATLIDDAKSESDIDIATIDSLADWLPAGRVDQKANDAQTLLTKLRDTLVELRVPLAVDFRFEHTEAWQQVVQDGLSMPPMPGSAEALALEQIKLDGTWQQHSRAGLLRHTLSFRGGMPDDTLDPERLAGTQDMLRRKHELWRADELAAWKEANGLDEQGYAALVFSEAQVQVSAASVASLDAHIVQELQIRGEYAQRLANAERLRCELGAIDTHWYVHTSDEPSPTLHTLLEANGIDTPMENMNAQARQLGFETVEAWRQALLHRYRVPPLTDDHHECV